MDQKSLRRPTREKKKNQRTLKKKNRETDKRTDGQKDRNGNGTSV